MQAKTRHAPRCATDPGRLGGRELFPFRGGGKVVVLAMVLMLAAGTTCAPAWAGDQSIKKVDIADYPGTVEITVHGSEPLSIETGRIGSEYIMFDISGRLSLTQRKRVTIDDGGIATIACGWFRSSPPVARISVRTTGLRESSVRFEEGDRQAVIEIQKAWAAAGDTSAKVRGCKMELSASAGDSAGASASAAAAEPKPVLVASAKPVATEVAQVGVPILRGRLQPRVSLDFVASDIHDVLKALAMQGGVNIVAGADVKGDVTVALSDVTVEEALQLIANLSGYRFKWVGNSYVVGTQESLRSLVVGGGLAGGDDRITDVIVVKYADPEMVGKILEKEFGMVQLTTTGDDSKDGPKGPSYLTLSGSTGDVRAARAMVEAIETATAAIDASSVVEMYEVKYADINELAALLRASISGLRVNIGPNQGFQLKAPAAMAMGSDSESTSGAAGGAGAVQKAPPKVLVIVGTQGEVDKAKGLLAELDVQQPQIMIEAKIVDLTDDAAKELGFGWTWPGNADTTGFFPVFSEIRYNAAGTASALNPLGHLRRVESEIYGKINALVEDGKAKVLASPNVLALDGSSASIFIGDEIKYVIRVEQTDNGVNVVVETARVGVQLHSVSRISSDGYITMNLHPEVSVINNWIDTPADLSLPEISRRFVDTTVRVKDGETIVIGGLLKDEEIETMSGIPILKDLPILGALFRNRSVSKTHSEVVMFITPRIVAAT